MTPNQISKICNDLYEECVPKCLRNALPSFARHYYGNHPNNKAGKAAVKRQFCEQECAKERNACFERYRRQPQEVVEFSNAERAIEWIKRNKEILVAGTIVVIAAVIFVAVFCASGGCVLLIPIILVADSATHTPPHLAEVCQ